MARKRIKEIKMKRILILGFCLLMVVSIIYPNVVTLVVLGLWALVIFVGILFQIGDL